MPIQQTRIIHCASCQQVIKFETYSDALDPLKFIRLFRPRKKQLCKLCKKAQKKRR